ncbi:MAG: flavohemoglobin expression-modulating QEGLA motif protein [Candidatus Eiseniibacteriota bacterium]
MTFPPTERDRIRRVALALRRAESPVRILSYLSWGNDVRERFLAAQGTRLPVVTYPRFDVDPTFAALSEARREIRGEGPVDRWLARQADAIETSARMLAAAGTPEFFACSRSLYGTPAEALAGESTTALALADQLEEVLAGLDGLDLGAPPAACHLASAVAERMREAVVAHFGPLAPDVVLVDELSANALAGPRAIRIRRTASFTDKDVDQLIHHEAYVHVGTSLNGRAQLDLPILAAGHAGTTRTQEGLAVFAEFVSGSMDLDRLSRLAGRVRAIQMAAEGANFLELFRFFQDRGAEPAQAFESARRVFRGGVLEGGAPFTKDVVYLDGLLRVHNFLRAVVVQGRADCLRLLFCGKLDLEDLPALCLLAAEGLCCPPLFLPPWAKDLRWMLAYLAYSAFLSRVKLDGVRERCAALLADAPRVESLAESVYSNRGV